MDFIEFQIAEPSHLDEICAITQEAKAQLKDMGIDQWQYGYPSREIWQDDIDKRQAIVALDEHTKRVMGAFVLLYTHEVSYDAIDGSWLTGDLFNEGAYASLHRVCVSDSCKGRGVAGKMFAYAEDLARKQGVRSMRMDTHPGNHAMLRSLEKAEYVRCGTIVLIGGAEDGSLRVAFEKILNQVR